MVDARVRLAAFLGLADTPQSVETGETIFAALDEGEAMDDHRGQRRDVCRRPARRGIHQRLRGDVRGRQLRRGWGNLLANGDFESGTGLPDNWHRV